MSAPRPLPITTKAAVAAWAVALTVCVVGLIFTQPPFRAENGFTILFGRHAEYLPFLPILLAVPLLARRRTIIQPARELIARFDGWATADRRVDFTAAVIIGVVAWLATGSLARQFEFITPTYHDEFSYLFQAQTFLRGELSAPGFPQAPALFDQMHVLSGDRMASRYFPGTGLWMAPFVAVGQPWLGHQLAHALCSVLIVTCGMMLQGRTTAWVAGLLFALSPGLELFSNLLLAHHPTLLGLLGFLACYLRGIKSMSPRWLMGAGIGLTFAMLCRPMTAAGFALPFGIYFVARLIKSSPAVATRCLVAMSTPLLLGFATMAFYNAATTGHAWTTPYQKYTDVHTPRHVYGFNNGTRGDKAIKAPEFDQSRRMGPYDDWAENLTLPVAFSNAGKRIESSMRLTLGVIPLTFVSIAWILTARSRPVAQWLLATSIVSLHVAHLPYWFSGIMHWHYVMESSICWLLLTGIVTRDLASLATKTKSDPMMCIWMATIGISVMLNNVSLLPWFVAERDTGAAEVDFARTIYAGFDASIQQAVGDRQAVVLIHPDQSTPQIDYVVNEPGLEAQILLARLNNPTTMSNVAALFPDRDVWFFDAATRQIQLVRRAR